MSAVQRRGLRVMIWVFAALAGLALALFIALQIAIARNGPAVLDTVDKVTATATGADRLPTLNYGAHPAQKLVVIRPKGVNEDARLPVLVFQHGGSWKDGDPEDYGFVGRGLATDGVIVVLAGYRLGAHGEFPAMLEDGAAGLAWVHANIGTYGGDPNSIFLMGHSAGAYNVAMLALDPQWLEDQSVPHSAIKGVIGLAGPYDFYPFDSDSTRATFGNFAKPEATQPVNFSADGAPRFLLIHGGEDTIVKPRNSRVLAAHLQAAGGEVELVLYENMDHTAPLLQLASPWRKRGADDDKASKRVHEKVRAFLTGGEAAPAQSTKPS